MSLPKNEKTFDFNHVGETTGKKYEGQFTVRCSLNMGMKHQLELEKSRLLADFLNPTSELAGIALILSNLRIKISEAPEWWKQSAGGFNLEDEDVLVELYKKLVEKELEYRNEIKAKAAPAAAPGAPADPNAPAGNQ
jgi:hypothetical protein